MKKKNEIENFLKKFSLKDFNKTHKVNKYFEFFELNKLLSSNHCNIYKPEKNDLSRLHFLILNRKVISYLEFGSGYSTLFAAHAISILKDFFYDYVKDTFRYDNPFHIYSIEESKKYLTVAKKLCKKFRNFISIKYSPVDITVDNFKLVQSYRDLFDINPDFIYLDGPSTSSNKKNVNGLSFNNNFRMPLSVDILKYEYLIEPGSFILVDGRVTNAIFLKNHLSRLWKIKRDLEGDVFFFELQDDYLGKLNKEKIKFCLRNKWML